MSYILDALRKSDQQRQRGTAPTLLAAQTAAAVAPEQRALLAYGLLAALLVGAGILIGWLRPWQPEQAPPRRQEPVASKPVESPPRESAPAPPEMASQPMAEPKLQSATRPELVTPAPSEISPQSKLQAKLQNVTRPALAVPAPSKVAPQSKPELPARAKPEADVPPREAAAVAPAGPTAAPIPKRPVDTAAADAAGDQTVISMSELPLSVRKELPAMTISVHAYSGNPAARMVSIDNRMLREGDSLVPGLKLEQITPDGMIFVYKEYRFLRGVK